MNFKKGQSLIELLVAMGVFVLGISAITFLILDSYVSGQVGREKTIATFLAEEGLEATRSIRDNDWFDLVDGNHGLATSVDNWIFQGTEDDLSDYLNNGKRIITIESKVPEYKKITSKITWEMSETRPQEVSLITYLTHWQKTGGSYCDGVPDPCSDFLNLTDCNNQDGCSWDGSHCLGFPTPCEEFTYPLDCFDQSECRWFFSIIPL